MDTAIGRLNQQAADEPARRLLVGCYHSLLGPGRKRIDRAAAPPETKRTGRLA